METRPNGCPKAERTSTVQVYVVRALLIMSKLTRANKTICDLLEMLKYYLNALTVFKA